MDKIDKKEYELIQHHILDRQTEIDILADRIKGLRYSISRLKKIRRKYIK